MNGVPEQPELDRFFGKHAYTLDAQRRITLPKAWRSDDSARNAFILMAGPHQTLQLIPTDLFQEMLKNLHRKVLFENRHDFLTLGSIGANTEKVSCDRQGRIALAQELLDGAGIRDRVILVGAIERIQIWDPQAWEASRLRAEEWLDAFEAIEKRPD